MGNVGSFVRLGWRDRAQDLTRWFMADRRPAAWNQWAEVVGRDARQPRFVGDMPHGWVASDFIRAALDLFATSVKRIAVSCWPPGCQAIGSTAMALRSSGCARRMVRCLTR
jgi:hypothetical protein